jgi:hypothetical protein
VERDDERLARAARALRQRQGLRQRDAVAPGRSRHFTLQLEAGEAAGLRLGDIREHFARFGATVRVTAWWNGASLDRLIDERHAAVIESGITLLRRAGWERTETEVTFNEWGERGSIDILAAHEPTESMVVAEAKSDWGSLEETIRVLDVKSRLAPTIAEKRFGFVPQRVAVLLMFPSERNARRIAQRYSATLATAFPARNVEIRRWLRRPEGMLRGLWFVTDVRADGPPTRRPR